MKKCIWTLPIPLPHHSLSEAKYCGDLRLTWQQIVILMCYSNEAFGSDKASFDSDTDAFRHNGTDQATNVTARRQSVVMLRERMKLAPKHK